ncbi:MAG: type I DNA topoisomerase [Thermodesulfobacteriota bacterium]
MAKSLVIIESPAKAKTINKFLGKGFQVKASIGHVKDLPKSKLGVDIEHDFRPEYVTIKGKGKTISDIKKAARAADNIYLAPDPDREGEAIAWHIAEELDGDRSRIYRVLINEITERAVLEAIKKPVRLDRNKYEAQQARRILDRLVGYEISPLLWKKVRRGLSAGRVQSVAVRLICDREAAIKAFVPEEYWSVTAELKGHESEESFSAKLAKKNGKKLKLKDRPEAQQILREIEGSRFVVTGIEKKKKKRFPLPPFITSRLQQEAVRKLGFTAKKTMLVAQQLYEGVELGKEGSIGLITYMRTDSTRISSEAIREVRGFINSSFGKDYLPTKPNAYPGKKGVQGAHEAIRPTYLKYPPYDIEKYLSKDHFNLYSLIWKRFIASQMNPAVFDQTSVQIEVETSKGKLNRYTFQASGSVVIFDGFTRVYVEVRDESGEEERREGILPPLVKDEVLRLISIEPRQHFTQPPPRFTEASLVRELEDNGIGRPSTYAPTLSTIQEREYVNKEKKQFVPTELGLLVTDLLVKSFPQVLDAKFTAHLEEELDKVEEGDLSWLKVVKEFYGPFRELLDKANIEMKDVKREEIPTDMKCEKCGKVMMIKWGKRGQFLACSGYPECKNTKDFVMREDGSIKILEAEETGEKCPTCGKPMIVKTGRFGRFLACSSYPDCKTVKPISTGVKCPMEGCDGELVERRSKRGKVFYSCSNYPQCKFATWEKPLGERCPMCDYPILLERHKKNGEVVKSCPNKVCGFKKETA